MGKSRINIRKDLAVEIFRRDGWLCQWCGRPVIFAPTLRYLERFAAANGFTGPLAYYHAHWTRRDAPLLDYMGAVLDHVDAHSNEGPATRDNLVTACNKCNALKSDKKCESFIAEQRRHNVRGKYGEPKHWDGLSTLFMILVEREPRYATASERDWFKHLRAPSH
jgi:5-methylcytosine-specific restriction endonuclease McrA